MNPTSTIGTCLAFNDSGDPATHDEAGFAALTPWTTPGIVSNMGDVGPERNIGTVADICDGTIHKFGGSKDLGTQAVTIEFDADNSAQQMLKAASDNNTLINVRETLSTGDIIYYKALVSTFKVMTGTNSDSVRLSLSLAISGDWVFVNAP